MASNVHVHERRKISLFDIPSLPDEILENVISFFSYEEISNLRLVSKRFDRICKMLLNTGFKQVEKFHNDLYKVVKSKLPRRESERRNHPLARHVDIFAATETRISLLTMTFTKYIEMGLCCFFPGKVLDEMMSVLLTVKNEPCPPRAHELLAELRDISSMAMEHFDEKVLPSLKAKMPTASTSLSAIFNSSPPPPLGGLQTITLSPAMLNLRTSLRNQQATLSVVKKELAGVKIKLSESQRQMGEQDKKMSAQNRLIEEQNKKIVQQDKLIGDMNRKVLEYDQKFVDLMAEVTRISNITRSDLSPNKLNPASDKSDNVAFTTNTTQDASDSNGNPLEINTDVISKTELGPPPDGEELEARKCRSRAKAIKGQRTQLVTRKRKACTVTPTEVHSAKNKK